MSKKDQEEVNEVDVRDKEQATPDKKSKKASKEPKKSPLEVAQEDLALEKDKFLRLFEEFENYKKRTSKERMDLFKTAGQEVITALLPVMDDFDRAMKELSKTENSELFKGVELINGKFVSILNQQGLEVIEVEHGGDFDAEIHDAVTQIPAPSEDLKGKIIDVIEKGYRLGDRIIRHPKVVVGN